ncbi:hypothetical protein, partial [Burkholderia cepacia]|uniref:hypothetical protein n=1 Tax=Burkholderia cepacia TaxID=292 RepID=UPI001C616B6F
MMWVYERDAGDVVAALPAVESARKRVPLKWFNRAMRQAREAGRESARAAGAPHLFDAGAA